MTWNTTPPDAAHARTYWIQYALHSGRRDWPLGYRIREFIDGWRYLYNGAECPLTAAELRAALAAEADLADQGEAR